MPKIDRRHAMLGAASVATAMVSSGLAACSYADPIRFKMPAEYFALVAAGRGAEARAALTADVTLSLATSEGAQFFQGPVKVTEIVDRLLGAEGFSMLGDTTSVKAGGLYWEPMGPWLCSDLVKGTFPQLSLSPCGDRSLSDTVLNVLVGMDGNQIRNITMIENNALSGMLIFGTSPQDTLSLLADRRAEALANERL